MFATKIVIQLLDRFFPKLLAKHVYHYLSNPNIRKLRDFEEAILDRSEQEYMTFKNFEIRGYRWGDSSQPIALLVHGWEGQAGNLGGLIEILRQKNYCVVAFDGPAHGKSSVAPTSMFEYAEFVAKTIGQYRPDILVSHSFGSVSTLMGVSEYPEWRLKKWMLVTTPHDFRERIASVAQHFGIGDSTVQHIVDLVEKETGVAIDNMNMDDYSTQVNNVDQALIVHSVTDKVIPISEARAVHKALPFSNLVELDGLGHYGILWSEALLDLVREYFPHCAPTSS